MRTIGQFARAIGILITMATVQGQCDCGWEDCTEDPQTHSTADTSTTQSWNLQSLSKTFGHLVGQELKHQEIQLDIEAVIQGLRQELAGQPAPMTETEYAQALEQIKESHFKELAMQNLALANAFMASNAKKPGVIALVPGKLQYRIIQSGKGSQVTLKGAPLIHYTGHFLDGTVFGTSDESGGPIAVHISQMIPGFRDGIVNMKEGEKRRLFIHPDMAYGDSRDISPNSILIFDIEIVKADVTANEQVAPKASSNNVSQTDTWDLPLNEEEDFFSNRPVQLRKVN